MRKKSILKPWYLLVFLFTISLVSCVEEEWDLEEKETQHSTVVEGTILSSDGRPIPEIDV